MKKPQQPSPFLTLFTLACLAVPALAGEPHARLERIQPLLFEETGDNATYVARGPGYAVQVQAAAARLRIGGAAIEMRLPGADAMAPSEAEDPRPARMHYLRGSDPAAWRRDVAAHARVRFSQVWAGIDVIYHGNAGRLEYDFEVAPGAAPRNIVLDFHGAASTSITSEGQLRLTLQAGEVIFDRPLAYQTIPGAGRAEVAAAYLQETATTVRFTLGPYDPGLPLVIDPVLTFATYLGGSPHNEYIDGVAVDAADNAYVTGFTFSPDFPTTIGAWDELCSDDGGCGYLSFPEELDAFISKFAPDGSLVYSTFLGGASGDQGMSIAVDGSGQAHLLGITRSADFPTTAGVHDEGPLVPDTSDLFVAALSADGSALVYSTYLGGSADDGGGSLGVIAMRPGGGVCVATDTRSADFPTTAAAVDTTLGGSTDAVVACLDAGATTLTYGTYLGGSSGESGSGLAFDGSGRALVTGQTSSSDFPTTTGVVSETRSGFSDLFVTRLDLSTGLVYSTFLGGSSSEFTGGIATDSMGNAYVHGSSSSSNFPTTAGAFMPSGPGTFLTKLNPTGTALLFSTFVVPGASNNALPTGLRRSPAGNLYMVGRVRAAALPAAPETIDGTYDADFDGYLVVMDPTAATVLHASYIGGAQSGFPDEIANDLAVNAAGDAWVGGGTTGTAFPTTPGAFQLSNHGFADGFLVRISSISAPPGSADLALTKTASPDPVPWFGTLTYKLTVHNLGPDLANQVAVVDSLPANVSFLAWSGTGWSCMHDTGVVSCLRDALAAGATAPDILIDVSADNAVGVFTNSAVTASFETDPNSANNTASAPALVDVADCTDFDGDTYVECGYCNPPAGKMCGDCNESSATDHIGATEVCDFYDNDCDGLIDEGLTPGTLALSLSGDDVGWNADVLAISYDLVSGTIAGLSGATYGDAACLENDWVGTVRADSRPLLPGEGYWYLVRGTGTCGQGTLNSGGPSGGNLRDAYMFSFPCP